MGLNKQTLDQFFANVVEQYHAKQSLAYVGQSPFTYAEFGRKVVNTRLKLEESNIIHGDRIMILGAPSPNWCVAFLAVTTMGAVAVPVMDEVASNDIDHIIKHSEAKAIFIADNIYESQSLTRMPKLKVFSLDQLEVVAEPLQPIEKRTGGQQVQEDDLAEILYTSGTTGHSKGVMLTHKNIVSNAIESSSQIGIIDSSSVVLGILPLAHAFGGTAMFLGGIFHGSEIHFLRRKPTPKLLLAAMEEVRPTVLCAVPLIFEKIFHKQVLPKINKSKIFSKMVKNSLGRRVVYRLIGTKIMKMFGGRLRGAIIGGASLNREVEQFLNDAKIPFAPGYGLSEAAPVVACCHPSKAKMGSVGLITNGCTVKIVEANEQGVGEILVKGPNVMQGYLKNDAATAEVFTEDGWLITGDRGFMDEEGYLYIRGRSKNVIIGPSGENIYPEVIEDKLKESLYVEEALVYAENNKVTARVYPDLSYIEGELNGTHLSNEDMQEYLQKLLNDVMKDTNKKLAASARVKAIRVQEEPFIKTPTKKIKRPLYVPNYGM
ncbi:AMP-binding protein [Persicobacter psychrovividus]|uniref:AMP-binding protein n=1 Tax=Persicobacter psychrovividus TaxID=387638 RepID=A0ABM7VC53_9BACT|nr:AMP-binding protein [Persicobacter psychrovividus]